MIKSLYTKRIGGFLFMTTATAMMVDKSEAAIFAKIKNVAGLLRISTEKTDSFGKKVNIEKTLKNHKDKMENFIDERKWTAELFEEVISGGKNVEDRPELIKLIDTIDKFDAILCMELTRLSRQGLSSQIIKEKVKKKGILIITMNPVKIYDMRIPQDAFLYDLSISMGEYERMLTSLRVKQNKISMAHQGLNSSGSVPMGYVRNKITKKLEIETVQDSEGNEIESPRVETVRQIFKWYLQGDGQRIICDRLNSMGIKNKSGRQWIPNSLRVLLTCPTYKGTLVAHSNEIEKGKIVPTETVVKHKNHPAIIDPETWEKAQLIRNRKSERSGVDKRSKDWNSKQNISILDGLIYCGCEFCGRKSTIKWYAAKNNFYIIKCSKYNASGKTCNNGGIAVKDIEHLVFEEILKEQMRIDKKRSKFKNNNFEDEVKELRQEQQLLENQKKNLENEYRAIRQQEQSYIKSGLKDEFEEELIAEDKKNNAAQRQAIQAKLETIQAKLQTTPTPEEATKKLDSKFNIIEELLNRNDLIEKQINVLLKEIILKITYKRELPDNYRSLTKIEKDKFPAKIKIEFIR